MESPTSHSHIPDKNLETGGLGPETPLSRRTGDTEAGRVDYVSNFHNLEGPTSILLSWDSCTGNTYWENSSIVGIDAELLG